MSVKYGSGTKKDKLTAPAAGTINSTPPAPAVMYYWRAVGRNLSIHFALENIIPEPAPQKEEKRKGSKVLATRLGYFRYNKNR